MATITIKRKNQIFQVTVDQEDYDKINELGKWYISNPEKGHIFYAEKQLTEKQFKKINEERIAQGIEPFKKQTILMHRYILDLVSKDTYKDKIVDHIDGNGLNNCRSNLRICDRTQNCYNRKLRSNSQTGYRGVTKYSKNSWRAYIKPKNQKRFYIGSFKTPEEAAKAYDEKAKELFGEFAKLNFP